jgi:hypothetical protein
LLRAFADIDLAVTERAMLELEVLEFRLKSLMLASLASVVLFGQDTLATGYTRTEVTSTFLAVNVADNS